MKRGSTIFLKIFVFLIGIAVLAFCILWLPWSAGNAAQMNPGLAYLKYPVLIGLYITAVPFFFALYKALKILGYIDSGKAFSELSVGALKQIKYCAVMISIMYAGGTSALLLSIREEHLQIAAVGSLVFLASAVVAVFAAVLQKLLEEAMDMKSENDLTI
jgi:hypothetical protein